jgi:uncharacterized protein (DUF2235 family)
MQKNIVLCCDGTANEFADHNTNVVKLFAVLPRREARQIVYYHPGLGTMEPAGALTTVTRKVTKLLGQAVGYGLERDIRDAYVFLMNNYEDDARVFLFGFSRGAYTARAVASLLHLYGLIPPGNEPLVPYIIRMMMAIQYARQDRADEQQAIDRYFRLAEAFCRVMARPCAPYFVGVWDTVSSVGWLANPLKLPYVTNNPDIAIGRHAVAIDEHRAFFRDHLWRPGTAPGVPAGPKDLRQVWFAGVHGDVGGGYAEAQSGLSKIALAWMIKESVAAGLLVDDVRRLEMLGETGDRFVKPNPRADAHESLGGWWNLAEYVPKRHFDYATRTERWRMNQYQPRTIPPRSLVHVSVRERGEEYCRRLPPDVTFVD